MAGITSYGAYVPFYRLNKAEIGKTWAKRTPPGELAVAGHGATLRLRTSPPTDRAASPEGCVLPEWSRPEKRTPTCCLYSSPSRLRRQSPLRHRTACQLPPENVPSVFGKDVPSVFGKSAPLLFTRDVPLNPGVNPFSLKG